MRRPPPPLTCCARNWQRRAPAPALLHGQPCLPAGTCRCKIVADATQHTQFTSLASRSYSASLCATADPLPRAPPGAMTACKCAGLYLVYKPF